MFENSEDFTENQKLRLLDRISNSHNFPITKRMRKAFLTVPREEFVLPKYRNRAYIDSPQPILANQTISAIHMVLMYISPNYTDPEIGDKVLEVGAGSGYNAAMFAEMVAPEHLEEKGHVFAVEIIPELVQFAKENIKKTGYSDVVTIIEADGGIGYQKEAPYDIISVAAASKKVPPPLKDQLNIGGRMIIPVGTFFQQLMLIRKIDTNKFEEKKVGGVRFVPLTGKFG